MKIIVHRPNDEQGQRLLRERVAKMHAAAVADYIGRLPCSKEQKLRLLDDIQQAAVGR